MTERYTTKENLVDRLKEASDSMIAVLNCQPVSCKDFKPFQIGINTDYCVFSFAYLRNEYGKSRVYNICYKHCQTHVDALRWKR